MKLYGFPPSPNTWKVRAVAHQVGQPLEFKLVDLSKGESRKPEFLALNPTGRTPVLVDGEFTLWESNAIMQYIGGKVKTPLWPDDARLRADIMRWQSWQLAHWSKACEPLLFQNLVKPLLRLGEPDPGIVAQGMETFHKEAPPLDRHLERHPYLVNDQLTLADFAVASYLFHAVPAKMPLDQYANVKRWYGRLAAMPAWQETAPKS